MNLDDITPLVLTYNEQANIERTLENLAWARQIIVVDSGSDNATVSIAERFGNVRLVLRPFDSHTAQWNFGLHQIETPWVLTLDADYFCPPSFADELRQLTPRHDAFAARFRYCIHGRPLRGTLYPPRVVLFHASRFRYVPDGHTQRLDVAASIVELQTPILHDDRKPLARWLMDQSRYADQEVRKLQSTPATKLGWTDRLRKRILLAAPATLFYCLFVKGLLLDGWPGIYYSLQRTYAEVLLSLKLLEAKLVGSRGAGSQRPSTSPPHDESADQRHCSATAGVVGDAP